MQLTQEQKDLLDRVAMFLTLHATPVWIVRECFAYEGEDIRGIYYERKFAEQEVELLNEKVVENEYELGLEHHFFDACLEHVWRSPDHQADYIDLECEWYDESQGREHWPDIEEAMFAHKPNIAIKYYGYKEE